MREELGERKRIDEGMRRRLGLGVEGERCVEHDETAIRVRCRRREMFRTRDYANL